MDDYEIGYVSGIIDGEGHIDLGNKRISIVNVSKKLLESVQKIVGGNIYLHREKWTDQNGYTHQKSWRLNIHRIKEIDNVLKAVMPHLRDPKKLKDAPRLLRLNSTRRARC